MTKPEPTGYERLTDEELLNSLKLNKQSLGYQRSESWAIQKAYYMRKEAERRGLKL